MLILKVKLATEFSIFSAVGSGEAVTEAITTYFADQTELILRGVSSKTFNDLKAEEIKF